MRHDAKIILPLKKGFFLKKVTEDEGLFTIEKLARKIWMEYYPSVITREQIHYMLEKMYHISSLRKDVKKGVCFYLLYFGKKPVGFIAFSEQRGKKFFIHKFYILKKCRGMGLGSRVFSKLIAAFSCREVRLTVNRQNFRSVNFYFKSGFIIERVEDFDIGGGFYMNDFVMVWKKIKKPRKKGLKKAEK